MWQAKASTKDREKLFGHIFYKIDLYDGFIEMTRRERCPLPIGQLFLLNGLVPRQKFSKKTN